MVSGQTVVKPRSKSGQKVVKQWSSSGQTVVKQGRDLRAAGVHRRHLRQRRGPRERGQLRGVVVVAGARERPRPARGGAEAPRLAEVQHVAAVAVLHLRSGQTVVKIGQKVVKQ